MSLLPPFCATAPAVESDYVPLGAIEKFDDLEVYTVGPAKADRAVIVIYDAFGFHPNTKQFADILANVHGFRVVMPDFFRGGGLTEEMLIADPERIKIREWMGRVGTWEVISPNLARVKTHLQSQGIKSAGIVGFCWGAKIAIQATVSDSWYAGAAFIHPAQLDLTDAEKVQAAVLLLPSKDEPDYTEFFEIIKKKPFGAQSYHQRFDDMPHGWVGARGDFKDPLNKQRASEAVQISADFFQTVVKA